MSILSSRISLTCPIPNVACSIQFVGFHFIKDDFRLLYSEPKLTGLFHEARDHQVFEKLSLRASRNSVAQPFAAPPERKPERPRGEGHISSSYVSNNYSNVQLRSRFLSVQDCSLFNYCCRTLLRSGRLHLTRAEKWSRLSSLRAYCGALFPPCRERY